MGDAADLRLSVIGQIAVTIHDLDRAVIFYRDRLWIPFLFKMPNLAFFNDPDGNTLAVMSEVRPEAI